jgi:RHS repeat-associated protein
VAGGTIGTVLNLAYSYAQSSHNNGNIATQTNNVDTGRTQNYTYDNLNRLLTAQTQATSGADCWGQSFGNNATPPTMATDALANLFYASSTQCSSPQPRFTMNPSPYNNEFTGTGISYDLDGNNTADTVYSYTFDAESRIITASGGGMQGGPYCYVYDGNGMRVEKANANGGLCSGTPTVDVLYWRNIAGNTIAETDATGSTSNANYHEYVFFAGRRVARSDVSSGNVYYYFVDQLGSTRIMTQANGTVCFDSEYFPYGQELPHTNTCNNISTTYKFTGYERDGETGLDYANARYYNSRLGRFMSGDPLGGDNSDPQSLNRYAYVSNNPVNLIDPSGMFLCGPALCSPGPGGSPFAGPGGGSGTGGGGDDFPLNCQYSPACMCHWRGTCGTVYPPTKHPTTQPPSIPPGPPTLPPPTNPPPPTLMGQPQNPCAPSILRAVNQTYGTDLTEANIQRDFTNGGAANLVLGAPNLPARQFNAIQPGRRPLSLLTTLIGYGPTLHIAGPGFLDPAAVFSNSNIGGATSITFTAHIDSAFAYNPIGAVIHLFLDVFGHGSRNPCP